MALTIQRLFAPAVLTTGAVTYYTCPATPASSVLKNGRVRFSNTTAGAVSITAYAVPLAGTAAAGNCFANAVSIAPNSYLDVDIPALAAGDFFQALASAGTAVTVLALDGVVFS